MCNLGQFDVLVYRPLAAEIQTCLHQASQGERIVNVITPYIDQFANKNRKKKFIHATYVFQVLAFVKFVHL